jgi:hypothetical protein
LLLGCLKRGGHLLLHDEWNTGSRKKEIFAARGLKLVDSFYLGEDVWWNEYYKCLEKKIGSSGRNDLFRQELTEISQYHAHPERFRSIYYILHYVGL